MNRLLILHLSDIHVRSKTDAILQRSRAIASSTYAHLPSVDHILLVISGDVAWSGKADEYHLAEKFVSEILAGLRVQAGQIKIDVAICPGNHDCDFSRNDETREAVLARIRSLESGPIPPSLVATSSAIQDAFFAFEGRVATLPWTARGQLSWQSSIVVSGVRVGVRVLNVAWMSELKEKQGTLVYPPEEITAFKFDKEQGLSITILHHPFNWFGQSTYRSFQRAVRHESHLVFTGHEHFQSVGEVSELHVSPSVFVEGGVLYEKNEPEHSTFNLVLVDLKGEQYLTERYAWNGDAYVAEVDEEQWGSLRALPEKGSQGLKLRSDFLASLSDPGAKFSHTAKKNLSLDDIFVWPELLLLDDPAVVKKHVAASLFEDQSAIGAGVFIRGDEKSGKSTLLKQYFQSYFGRGYLPLYFRASWFSSVHQRDPLKALRYALEKQYERVSHPKWLQEGRDKKILLVDDLDLADLKGGVLSQCLTALSGYFNFVIVTARDSTEALDLLSIERVEAVRAFTRYELREFGHKKRFELVCKWAAVGGQTEGSDEWMAKIDRFEKDLTDAVGKQFVPAVPIFLLTLLQSIESGRNADLQNSAFGHYYQYLVTSALEHVGVDRKQWGEVFNYCASLAWFVHSSGEKHVAENVLAQFNEAYSKEFTPVALHRRSRELIEAGVLAKLDGQYEFKYPYLFYLFLGQYLADNIHDPKIQSVVISLCDDLHLRDNANVLLFTSHHTKSPFIYEKIADALEECFELEDPFDFDRDVAAFNALVDSAPRLVYQEVEAKESRAKQRESDDTRERNGAGDLENSSGAIAESAAAVTRLFRAVEILGQFLKNHYGTTRNPVKDELIDRLFAGTLRGLHALMGTMESHSTDLADYVEQLLQDKRPDIEGDPRKALARKIVFDIIGMICFGFVQKAASSVGSEYLKQNVAAVTDKNGSLSYRLIEISHQMDLPEPLPFPKLKALNKALDKNVFGRALLASIALRHLHLFKVPYKDKQRLCEELGIGLSKQMALQQERQARLKGLPPQRGG